MLIGVLTYPLLHCQMMLEEVFGLELHEKSTTVVFQGVDTWHDISNTPLQHDGTELQSTSWEYIQRINRPSCVGVSVASPSNTNVMHWHFCIRKLFLMVKLVSSDAMIVRSAIGKKIGISYQQPKFYDTGEKIGCKLVKVHFEKCIVLAIGMADIFHSLPECWLNSILVPH